MRNLKKIFSRRVAIFIPLFLFTFALSAQEKSDYEVAKEDIIQTFGIFPSMFEVFPEHALSGAWETYKQLNSPDNKIPPKYQQLIQLAVAAQIPCEYCIYYHIAAAQMLGATDEEIQEAVAHGAATRHWSMILKGNQIDFEEFKVEMKKMMEFMSEKK